MATNKFLEFNTSKENMQTDEEYSSETQRLNGVSGIAKARMHNKLFRQLSVMAAAIGEFIKSAGNDASDTDVDTLVTAISNSFASKTSVDQKSISQTAGGTATAITLSGISLINGFTVTFVVAANNNGAATTINGKPLYKPGGTAAPKLVAGKAVTVWYNGTNFFIKASAEGDAVAADVLAGKVFSNDDDTGLTGSIPSKSAATYTPGTSDQTIAAGQYLSGAQTIKATTGTATAGDVLAGKTFNSANGIGLTGNMANQGAKVITPGTANQTISAGYHNGSGYVVGDPDLIPANILNTANIFGVQGAAQAGKRWATGTKVSINYAEPFEGISGSAHTTPTLEITGLTFKPSTIVISAFTGTLYLLTTYWGINIATVTSFRNNNVNIDRYYCLKILNDAYGYVSATGFKMPVAYGNITYTWVAYE